MGTILESTNELAKRFGVEGEMTIKDTLDAIVKKLDDTYTDSKDIAEAVAEFSKNDGPDARLDTKSITENGTYAALDDDLDGYSSVTVNVSGGVGFQLMNLSMSGQPEDLTGGTTYINNDSATVDLSTIFSTNNNHSVIIINPVDELRVTSLESFGNGYTISFVPTQNCKVYEDSTELDLNDIFQSQQTPTGPTVYEPNGVKVHRLEGEYSPYDGKTRKLYDNGGSMYLTIE